MYQITRLSIVFVQHLIQANIKVHLQNSHYKPYLRGLHPYKGRYVGLLADT